MHLSKLYLFNLKNTYTKQDNKFTINDESLEVTLKYFDEIS